MPNLSIKNVPDELLLQLRARAKDHHRSLQGELMAILENAVGSGPLTIEKLHQQLGALEIRTGEDATSMVRADRDAR